MNKIYGNNVLIVGDLHISDVFSGRHKDYLTECIYSLDKITEQVQKCKPAALFLGGDLVGYDKTNIRSREIFTKFCKYFIEWNKICPVYSVRGNHDLKGYPDFNVLHELGLLRTSEDCNGYVDYYPTENATNPQIRFHIVDYGAENRELNIKKNSSNVVLGHNNFYIEGVTTWYAEHEKLILNQLRNFKEVDAVISGHIHNPSPDVYETNMDVNKTCMLFYTGCPTRPIKEKTPYPACWFVDYVYDESSDSCVFTPILFELLPIEDCFYPDENFVTDENTEAIAEKVRKEALANVLGDMVKYQIQAFNLESQIQNIPNATEEAKKLAITYINKAMGNE